MALAPSTKDNQNLFIHKFIEWMGVEKYVEKCVEKIDCQTFKKLAAPFMYSTRIYSNLKTLKIH